MAPNDALRSDDATLLTMTRNEIAQLRRENEILRAKVETMDLLCSLLGAAPLRQGGAMSPDVVWELDRRITALHVQAVIQQKGQAGQ